MRIRKNLSFDIDDVVAWCKDKINSVHAIITRKGRNWYVNVDDLVITVNAYSYTVITAHKERSKNAAAWIFGGEIPLGWERIYKLFYRRTPYEYVQQEY